MDKHISQTFVSIPDVDRSTEMLCVFLRDCALSIDSRRTERVLDFGDGQAIIRQTACGLHLRVEADDLATFFGIRSLLQVALSQIATHLPGHLEWHPAGNGPFGVIGKQAGSGGC